MTLQNNSLIRTVRIGLIVCMALAASTGLGFDDEAKLSRFGTDEGFIIETVTNDLDREVVLSIRITDLQIGTRRIGDETYTTIGIGEAGSTMSPGRPVLPMIGKLVHVSDTLDPEVSVRILESHREQLAYPVVPYQMDLELEDVSRIRALDQNLYALDQWYPANRIVTEDPVAMREIRLKPVGYYPVQYNAVQNTVDIADRAEIVIRMIDRPTGNTIESHGPYSATWESLYRAVAPNYSDRWIGDRDRNIPEHYFFIMPDEFEARCQGFFAWKEQQGFVIDVVRLSELGTSPTYTDVKNAFLNMYQSESRMVYASIIGSTNNFPIHESHDNYMSGNFDDDLYYSQLEGGDYFPDVFLSRYPATDPDELTVMLSRILYYEQTPPDGYDEYYKSALMACSGLYASQQLTKEQTADRLTTNLAYEQIHTMYNWTSGSVAQVQSWINRGVTIINYRGEGWQAGWHPGHSYDFEYPEVFALHNGPYFPVITSIGCGVSMFDGYTECFGHAWMTHGTLQDLHGAVAFMGPTWNTRTTINNWIDRGIYRGFCYHDITRSSPAFNYGKFYAYEHFIGTQYMTNDIPTHMREYLLFGNPDLWWRTGVPRNALVFNAWPPDSGSEGMVVIDEHGNKVANAQVSFLKDTESRVYVTDSGGGCRLHMSDIVTPVPYTLTGWNLMPCSGMFDLPETGDDGDLVITEVKPDIETTGTAGDKVEIANLETDITVNLRGWTIGDLDGYDIPFVVDHDAILGPHQIAVIELVGYFGAETVAATGYGLHITSRAVIGLSSLEDCVVLRNTEGRVRDAICWHNGTGIGSTDATYDLSKLTLPTSSLSMGFRGWWEGPDEVTREEYESLTVDWSVFAGNGGPGSIQRTGIPGSGIYDSPDLFMVSSFENFGEYSFSEAAPAKDLLEPVN
ncbi:hypothetical protein JXA40_10840 [bacterium]|nr:hypothetical protein [candidate division CSSED10-310 bacterium]